MDMSSKRKAWIVGLVMVLAFAILVLERLRLPHDTLLWREIQNTGHTPLFGIIALVCLGLSHAVLKKITLNSLWHYILAFLATIAIGAISELSQIFRSRDADIWDLVRDIIGALGFLGLHCSILRARTCNMARTRFRRSVIAVLSVAVLIGSVLPVTMLAVAYKKRDVVFPVIMDSESRFENMFVTTQNSSLDAVRSPSLFSAATGSHVGRLVLFPATYSGFRIDDPYPDWLGRDTLLIDFYSDEDMTIQLILRIDDRRHNQSYDDRFNYSFPVPPGQSSISVPLDRIRTAPARREMQMQDIAAIHIFAFQATDTVTLYLDNMRLK
jgi:hypothetical protein